MRRSFLLRRRPVVDAEATLALERGREEDPLGMAVYAARMEVTWDAEEKVSLGGLLVTPFRPWPSSLSVTLIAPIVGLNWLLCQ